MILIERKRLIAIGVIVLVATVFLGVYGYRTMLTLRGGEAAVLRSQWFLYVALLCAIVELLFFARAIVRSRNIERELEKLIEITHYRGLSKVQSLTRLGPIGDQIQRLYDQLSSLSDRKSLKISSLSELTEFLMNNISIPAAVVTVDGSVAYVSRVLTERWKRPRNELIDSRLDELAPGITVAEVVAELDRSHSSVQRKSERAHLTFYPIRNSDNQLAYIVCVFEGYSLLVEQARRVATDKATQSYLGSGVRRLVGFGRTGRRRGTKVQNNREGGARSEL